MIVNDVPPFFPEVRAHWRMQLEALHASNASAQAALTELAKTTPTESQMEQALLQELSAAQTYNSFVESGSQYIKMAQDAESRLQRRDLSLLEIIQLKTTRDTMYALSAEFISFKAENQVVPMHLRPVESGGQTHYIDGRVEWNDSVSGLAGQAWEGLQEIAAGVKETLIRGPFTTEENYAICQSALGSLLPQLAGKTIAAPGGGPGEILWGEALGKALDAADPAGQMCRVVYPPGTSPQDVWRLGQVIEGFDPVANSSFTAVLFMPPEMAEARLVSAFVETGADQAWNEMAEAISAFTGVEGLPLFDAADAWPQGQEAQKTQDAASGPATLQSVVDPADGVADFAPGIGSDELWFRQAGLEPEMGELGGGASSAADDWGGATHPEIDAAVNAQVQVQMQAQFSQLMDLLTQSIADFEPPPAGSAFPAPAPYASVVPPVLSPSTT